MPYYRNDISLRSFLRRRSSTGSLSFPTLMIAFSIRSLEQLRKTVTGSVSHFHIQSLQHLGEHFFRCVPCPSSIDVTDWIFAIFSSSFANHRFLNKRHHLYDKSTCASHGISFVHQDSQSYRGRNLFGCCKIIGESLPRSPRSAGSSVRCKVLSVPYP